MSDSTHSCGSGSGSGTGLRLAVLGLTGFLMLVSSSFTGSLSGTLNASPIDPPPVLDPTDLRHLFRITSDAAEGYCDLFVTVDERNALTGAAYRCTQKPDQLHRYSLDQIRKGIAFREGPFGITSPSNDEKRPPIVKISAPQLDAVSGGDVNVEYLSNGLTEEYKNFPFQALKDVPETLDSWTAFLPPKDGQLAFNRMFLKKRTVMGQPIGIKCVGVSWKDFDPAGEDSRSGISDCAPEYKKRSPAQGDEAGDPIGL